MMACHIALAWFTNECCVKEHVQSSFKLAGTSAHLAVIPLLFTFTRLPRDPRMIPTFYRPGGGGTCFHNHQHEVERTKYG